MTDEMIEKASQYMSEMRTARERSVAATRASTELANSQIKLEAIAKELKKCVGPNRVIRLVKVQTGSVLVRYVTENRVDIEVFDQDGEQLR